MEDKKKMKWIPLEIGKPLKPGTYIITAREGPIEHVTFAKYQVTTGRFEMRGRAAYWKVIAWMHLPKPYDGETLEAHT